MYLKKILFAIIVMGLIAAGVFTYKVYHAIFSPNTKFTSEEVFVYIPSSAEFGDVSRLLEPFLKDGVTFRQLALRKGYVLNVKAGKYALKKGMNNNEIINALRSNNIPIKVSFNNQERAENLAGRIASQIEADSLSLLDAMRDSQFMNANGLDEANLLTIYIPNSYEFLWNTSAEKFRDRMLAEYQRFWNEGRLNKATALNLSPSQVISLASIVHKETAKVDERPRVAGVYLNRLRKNMLLQADPTVIYAIKKSNGNFDTVIKRVLYKDLELDSPYNTYKYAGLPPGPIAMPDISAIDAVLNPENHDYLYFVANVENFGYHKFAKDLVQHNRNKEQYIRWINAQQIKR